MIDWQGIGQNRLNNSNKQEMEIECQTGMAVIFEHNVLHEGTDVTLGTKYCIRCDVLYSAQTYDDQGNLIS